jgi:hypothetical protein
MTRPTTINDLDEYEKRGDLLISWGPGIAKAPSADALVVASRAALIAQYGDRLHWAGDSVYAPPEPGVLEARLLSRQRTWDSGHEAFEKMLEDGQIPEPRWTLDNWLRIEGKPKAEEVLEQRDRERVIALQAALDKDDDRANPDWDPWDDRTTPVQEQRGADDQPSQYAEENVAGTVADLDREDALPDDGKHRSFDDVAEAGDDLRDSEIPAAISAELDQAMAQARDAEANGRALLPKLDSVKEGTIPDF